MNRLLLLIFPMLLFGCVTLNSHQTGRTLGKDNQSMFGSFNHGSIDSDHYTVLENGKFYIAEAGGQFGYKEKIDLGCRVNSSMHFTAISKYQYLGDKKSLFASSIGLDLGAAPFNSVVGQVSYSGTFSLYNSIHISEGIALTLTPSYNFLGHSYSKLLKDDRFEQRNIYGYSSGLIIGKKFNLSLEYSQYVNNERFHFRTKPIFSIALILNISD